MHSSVFNKIGHDLHIWQDSNESDSSYYWRLMYSASGAMALASLFDQQEEYFYSLKPESTNYISVHHFKRNSTNCFRSLLEAQGVESDAQLLSDISQKQLDTYARTGYCLKAPYKVRSVQKSTLNLGALHVIRGGLNNYIRPMAGLAQIKYTPELIQLRYYLKTHSAVPLIQAINDYEANTISLDSLESARSFFALSIPLSKVYKDYIDILELVNFAPLNSQENCELYDLIPGQEHCIFLGRFNNHIPANYFYYYRQKDKVYYQEAPKFLINDYYEANYNNKNISLIKNALYQHHNMLKPIKVVRSNELVQLHGPFYLPGSERALLDLLSWPSKDLDYQKVYMSLEAFYLFYHLMNYLGYSFNEELTL